MRRFDGSIGSLLLVLGTVGLACHGDDPVETSVGTLEITTSTSGTGLDVDGYTFQVDAAATEAIGSADTTRIDDLAGDHVVRLGGVAANCVVAGENPRAAVVAAGETATVRFIIACSAETSPPYQTTDLGTLGGPQSSAQDINDADQIAGWSLTSPGDAFGQAFLWEASVMKNLDPGGRYWYSSASFIGPNGEVIGTAGIGTGGVAGLIWKSGVATDLGNLGSAYTGPGGINDVGQVVGASALSGAALEDPPEIDHAFVWRDGIMTDLGTLGGNQSAATSVNSLGQIVGWSQTSTQVPHLVIWQDGGVTDLGTLGACCIFPAGINRSGQVAGTLMKTPDGPRRAFFWEKGVLTEIGDWAAGYNTFAYDINETGQVVGYQTNGGVEHAFLWEKGVMTDLSVGFVRSAAYGINSGGKVVGSASVAGGDWHATLWVPKSAP
jgi:probable HAF family extracellular repeat protein